MCSILTCDVLQSNLRPRRFERVAMPTGEVDRCTCSRPLRTGQQPKSRQDPLQMHHLPRHELAPPANRPAPLPELV